MGLISWLMRIGPASSPGSINIASPEVKANPFTYYAQLRTETPVRPVPLPYGEQGWLVTRYDVALVLKDERFVKGPPKLP